MATTISTGNSDNDTITGVRLDIARLEGLLTGFLTDGVRRIDQSEKDIRVQRVDMNAMDNKITTNTSNITDIRKDITNLEDKQNAAVGKIVLVVSPLISAAALLWGIVGK